MPVVPSTPYDTAEAILNIARSISADAATSNGLSGDILNDNQPYVFPILAKCYRDLQDRLISGGVETFSKYGHIYGITPADTLSPRTLVNISYLGYWDGNTHHADIKIPCDLLKPLELWECQSGGGTGCWTPMEQASDSISSRPIQARFTIWDYENDILYLPASSQTNDLKLKYLCYAPDLTCPYSQVYVMHCQTALANMMVASVVKMLGGLEMVPVFEKDVAKAVDAIINRTARKESYAHYARRPFRGRRGSGRGRG